MGLTDVSVGFYTSYLADVPALAASLTAYVTAAAQIPGAAPVTAKILTGSRFAPDAVKAHLSEIQELIAQLVEAASHKDG
jgi:hypothetical protein